MQGRTEIIDVRSLSTSFDTKSQLRGAYLRAPAVLEVGALHIQVVQKLAALVDLHLVVDVADVGVHGVGGDDQLVGHGAGGVAAGDEQQYLAFAGRQGELGGHLGTDFLHLVFRWRGGSERHDAELHAHERYEHDGQQAHEAKTGGGE